MSEITPVLELIKAVNSESTVINAPGQEALSYAGLLNLVENYGINTEPKRYTQE